MQSVPRGCFSSSEVALAVLFHKSGAAYEVRERQRAAGGSFSSIDSGTGKLSRPDNVHGLTIIVFLLNHMPPANSSARIGPLLLAYTWPTPVFSM